MSSKFEKIVGILIIIAILAIAAGVLYMAFFKSDKDEAEYRTRMLDLQERQLELMEGTIKKPATKIPLDKKQPEDAEVIDEEK